MMRKSLKTFQEDFNVTQMEFRLKMVTKIKTTSHYKIQGNNTIMRKKQYIGQNNKMAGRDGLIHAVIDEVSRQIDYEMMSEFLHISKQPATTTK